MKSISGISSTQKPAAATQVKSTATPHVTAATSTATGDARTAATVVKKTRAVQMPATTNTTTSARTGATAVLTARLASVRKEVGAELTKSAPARPEAPATKAPDTTPDAPRASTGKSTPGAAGVDHAAFRAQQEALGAAFTPAATPQSQEQAAAYFATHDTYIDPTTGIEYAADYDPATGTLELERADIAISPENVPGASDPRLESPVAEPGTPLDTSPPPVLVTKGDQAASVAAAAAKADGAALDKLAKSLAMDAVIDGATGARMSVEGAIAAKLTSGTALIAERDRATLGGVGAIKFGSSTSAAAAATAPSTATMDELIIITIEGDRVTERTYAVAPATGELIDVTERIESSHDGTVTGGSIHRTSALDAPTGSERFERTETFGQGGVITGREQQVVTTTPDGAVTSESAAASFSTGIPTASNSDIQYRFGTVTATESANTSYEDGVATGAVIEQHALDTSDTEWWIFGQEAESARIVLTYDADGMVTAVEGPGATNQQTSLTAVVADHPTAAGETFAFSQVRTAPGEIDGIPTPALVSGPGIVVHDGEIQIFQEGGRAGQSGPAATELTNIHAYIAASPDQLLEPLTNIDLLDGRNPQDAYWEERYGMEDFGSAAFAGGGRITFLNNSSNDHIFYHELGHVWGVDGGSPDDAAWADAIEADAGIDDAFAAQGEVVDNQGVLVDDTDGVSGYADESYANSGAESEDWADSVQLWLLSRHNGGLITVRLPDGTEQVARFDDLYPNRAAILEAHYGS